MFKFLLFFFSFSALGSLIIDQFPVAIKFDRAKYQFTQPKTFGTRGLILLLKDQSGYQNFSLSSAGFIPSKDKFESECKKTHESYKKHGGKMSKLLIDSKGDFPKCRFQRKREASFDIVEITFDPQLLRSYIFSGVLLKINAKSLKKYKKEFNKLAKGISYNIESKR